MRKQNKLYTANKWNQPLFAQGVDRRRHNIFDGLLGSNLEVPGNSYNTFSLNAGQLGSIDQKAAAPLRWDRVQDPVYTGFDPLISWGIGGTSNKKDDAVAGPYKVGNYQNHKISGLEKSISGIGKTIGTIKNIATPKVSVPTISLADRLAAADRLANPWNYTLDGGSTTSQYLASTNKLGISKANNPFSKVNAADTAAGIAQALAPVANTLISDGFSTKEGAAVSTIGNAVASGLAATGVGAVPAAVVAVASNIIGGVLNRGGGVKWNNKGRAVVEGVTKNLNSSADAMAQQTTNEGVLDAWKNTDFGTQFSKGDIGKDGWWGRKAKKEYRKQLEERDRAKSRARRGFLLGVENADNILDDNIQSQFIYADGGFLDNIDLNNMGAVDFNFMSDYLTQKNRQNSLKDKISGIPSMPAINSFGMGGCKGGILDNIFAIGGDLQTNGADYSIGKVYNVSEEEANRLKAMGYEFTVVE